jgi:hypothetical protein
MVLTFGIWGRAVAPRLASRPALSDGRCPAVLPFGFCATLELRSVRSSRDYARALCPSRVNPFVSGLFAG